MLRSNRSLNRNLTRNLTAAAYILTMVSKLSSLIRPLAYSLIKVVDSSSSICLRNVQRHIILAKQHYLHSSCTSCTFETYKLKQWVFATTTNKPFLGAPRPLPLLLWCLSLVRAFLSATVWAPSLEGLLLYALAPVIMTREPESPSASSEAVSTACWCPPFSSVSSTSAEVLTASPSIFELDRPSYTQLQNPGDLVHTMLQLCRGLQRQTWGIRLKMLNKRVSVQKFSTF